MNPLIRNALLLLSLLQIVNTLNNTEDFSYRINDDSNLGSTQPYSLYNPFGNLLPIHLVNEINSDDLFTILDGDEVIPLLDLSSDYSTALTSSKIVIIITYINSSDQCIKMTPHYIQAAKTFIQRTKFYRAYATSTLSNDIKTKQIPTAKVFRNGTFVDSIVGYMSLQDFEDKIETMLRTYA